jgi:hemolysin activation/secretion protein
MKKHTLSKTAFAAAAALFAPCAFAQPAPAPAPAAMQSSNIEELRRLERERRSPEKPASPVDASRAAAKDAPAPAARDDGPRFKLARVAFDPSDVFESDYLRGVSARYTNREVSFGDLRELCATLNAEYRRRGYPVNIANVPPQKIGKEGELRVQLVEARVGRLVFEGNRAASDGYYAARLGVAPGAPVNVNALEDAFIWANRAGNAAIAAELRAGAKPGETDIIARVAEPSRADLAFFSDNGGRRSTGAYRSTLMARGNNWAFDGDALTLSGIHSKGASTAFAAYEAPVPFLGPLGVTAGADYSYGETKIISGEYAALDIAGVSHSAGGHVTAPLVATADFFASLTLAGGYYHSTTDYVTVLSDKEETAFGNASANIEWNFWAGYTRAAAEYRGGFGWLGKNNPAGDPREGVFHKVSGSLYRRQTVPFAPVLTLNGLLYGQLAGDGRLPASEQFQLGGHNSVRGYPEGVLLGDHGYLARGEAHLAPPRLGAAKGSAWDSVCDTVSVFGFIDHGAVFPFSGRDLNYGSCEFATSAGGGVSLNFKEWFFATLTYAKPLDRVPFGKPEENWLFRTGVRAMW